MRRVSILTAIWLFGCMTPPADFATLPTGSLDECNIRGLEAVKDFDVAIAIDTSGSTADPSGMDIDGDGAIGTTRDGVADRGDSLLVAEVAAIKALVPEFRLRSLNVAIVSFAGQERFDDPQAPVPLPDALLIADLTSDPVQLETALERLLVEGSRGTANFAAAMRRSVDALEGAWRATDSRRRVVLMISDSPSPVLPGPTLYLYRTPEGDPHGPMVYSDPKMAAAAKRAIRSGVVIKTFGIGKAARIPPPHALSHIAKATGGRFHAVTNPAQLHCALMGALASR